MPESTSGKLVTLPQPSWPASEWPPSSWRDTPVRVWGGAGLDPSDSGVFGGKAVRGGGKGSVSPDHILRLKVLP